MSVIEYMSFKKDFTLMSLTTDIWRAGARANLRSQGRN